MHKLRRLCRQRCAAQRAYSFLRIFKTFSSLAHSIDDMPITRKPCCTVSVFARSRRAPLLASMAWAGARIRGMSASKTASRTFQRTTTAKKSWTAMSICPMRTTRTMTRMRQSSRTVRLTDQVPPRDQLSSLQATCVVPNTLRSSRCRMCVLPLFGIHRADDDGTASRLRDRSCEWTNATDQYDCSDDHPDRFTRYCDCLV